VDGELTVLGTMTVPGTEPSVALVRRFAHTTLGTEHPCLDDVRLCLSELATNAVKHSDSGLPGGLIDVLIAAGHTVIRVEVTDDGVRAHPSCGTGTARTGAAAEAEACVRGEAQIEAQVKAEVGARRHAGAESEGGRGLPIVDALAARWGIRLTGPRTVIWAEFTAAP
jgi:anti-sigma regulatory factor (Ser/Thr protein kinase)